MVLKTDSPEVIGGDSGSCPGQAMMTISVRPIIAGGATKRAVVLICEPNDCILELERSVHSRALLNLAGPESLINSYRIKNSLLNQAGPLPLVKTLP